MPVYIECTSCHRKLRVRTELIGKNVRCPNCRAKFIAAPLEGAAPSSVETSMPAEGASAILTPSPAVEGEDSSSGPTVRRPVPELSPETATPAGPPREGIVANPPSIPAEPKPTPSPSAACSGRQETPWSKLSLVVGVVLLSLVLLGLLGAWWIDAGMQAAKGKHASGRSAGPGTAWWRPGPRSSQFSLKSNFCTVSLASGLATNFL